MLLNCMICFTMSVDIKNAFNTCNRALLLKKLYGMEELRKIFPIVNFTYSSPSKLNLPRNADILLSSNGVRQGDPLSSLLFCLYMKDIYHTLASKADVTLYSYSDNLYIVGKSQEVINAFHLLQQQLDEADLECNTSKSSFIYFHSSTSPLPTTITDDLHTLNIEIRDHHAEVVGVPIGATDQDIID